MPRLALTADSRDHHPGARLTVREVMLEDALTALTHLATQTAGTRIRVRFIAVDGRSWLLDTEKEPPLVLEPKDAPRSVVLTEVLCNARGVAGLFAANLGEDPAQVFFVRGEKAPVLALADRLSTRTFSPLSIRGG